MRRKVRIFLMFVLLIVGIGVLLYPDIASWYHSRRHISFIQEYNESIALMAAQEIEDELQRARDHNATITDISINNPWGGDANDVTGTEEYYTILDFGPNGVMARIEIPVINVDLPVFHGATSEVLDRGVGHMPHTPFPIGGYGNHSILTAHTGLINIRLFTDLVRVTYGDIFVVTVAGKRKAYEVEQIDVVLPEEIEILQTYPDRDLITLVTCTPYAVNSHRLLVRGTRIEYVEGMVAEIESITELSLRQLIVATLLLVLLLITIIKRRNIAKRK